MLSKSRPSAYIPTSLSPFSSLLVVVISTRTGSLHDCLRRYTTSAYDRVSDHFFLPSYSIFSFFFFFFSFFLSFFSSLLHGKQATFSIEQCIFRISFSLIIWSENLVHRVAFRSFIYQAVTRKMCLRNLWYYREQFSTEYRTTFDFHHLRQEWNYYYSRTKNKWSMVR